MGTEKESNKKDRKAERPIERETIDREREKNTYRGTERHGNEKMT